MPQESPHVCFVTDARLETNGRIYWDPLQNFPVGHWTEALQVFSDITLAARVRHREGGEQHGPSLPPAVRVIEFPYFIGLPQAFTKTRRLFSASRRTAYEADICVLRGPGLLSMLVWAWLAIRRRPYAVEVLGDLEAVFAISPRPGASWARRLIPPLVRRICRGAAAILYVSRVLESKYPPAPGAVRTVVSDVRMPDELFRPPRQFANPPKRMVIVHVGNMEQIYKGHDTMIRAVMLCRQRGVDVELHFLGDGRLRGSFENLARELGVQNEVVFEGSVAWGPELFAHLDRSHLFLLPSLTEGVPKALIEAMARGLPVIASRVGGIPDLVDEDMLITPGDPEMLAARIAALASDHHLLNDVARRCRDYAARFTDQRLSPLRHAFYTAVRKIAATSGKDVA